MKPILFLSALTLANALTATPRRGHGAALMDNKLYFYGGKLVEDNNSRINELLALDLSNTISLQSSDLPYENLTISDGPRVVYPGFAIGGAQNKALYLYGGVQDEQTNRLHTYDTAAKQWFTPSISLPQPPRQGHNLVTRLTDGKLFMWGGENAQSPETPVSGNVLALDTSGKNNGFVEITAQGTAPSARYHHTLTMVGEKIYILGGRDAQGMVGMDQVAVYDTQTNSWTLLTAGGDVPAPRRQHTTVATKDGKLILFGGTDSDYNTSMGDIAVLDTTANPPVWSRPTVQGTAPAGRYDHTCTMAGTRMVCAFGYLQGGAYDGHVIALDSTSWTWMPQYSPDHLEYTSTAQTAPPPSSGSSSSGSLNGNASPNASGRTPTGALVGGIIGGIVGLAAIGALAFLFIRRKKPKKDDEFLSVPFENTSPSYSQYDPESRAAPMSPGKAALLENTSHMDLSEVGTQRTENSAAPMSPAMYEQMRMGLTAGHASTIAPDFKSTRSSREDYREGGWNDRQSSEQVRVGYDDRWNSAYEPYVPEEEQTELHEVRRDGAAEWEDSRHPEYDTDYRRGSYYSEQRPHWRS
ncbi:uncharacterized protein VTP21DRAFT_6269 [Calcarisporiella thermophila]|uniref:uncharacterized protein n=1 Tax=Calcarisporiella thermophila TaxID=911321 RepID=UPI00374378DD